MDDSLIEQSSDPVHFPFQMRRPGPAMARAPCVYVSYVEITTGPLIRKLNGPAISHKPRMGLRHKEAHLTLEALRIEW